MDNIVINQVKEFLFGGVCKTTLTSMKTGTQFTYTIRINRKEDIYATKRMYYIGIAQGHNESVYAGFIRVDFEARKLTYTRGSKGKYSPNTKEIKALVWVLEHALMDKAINGVQIQHFGCCAVCGKELTDAEGKRTGIGPKCRKQVS